MRKFNPSGTGSMKLDLFSNLWKIPGVKYMYFRNDDNKPDNGILYLERKDNKTGKITKGSIEYQGHGKNQKTKCSKTPAITLYMFSDFILNFYVKFS